MRLTLVTCAVAMVLASAAQAKTTSAQAIATFKEKYPKYAGEFSEAHGYAVFPTVGKGAVGVGGAHGSGDVYEGGHIIGHATLTQVTVGFQLGGQAYSEFIFFHDKTALDDFTKGQFELDAQASAVALTAGASGDMPYRKGIAIVTMAKGGLMYEASVGGQKFSYKPAGKETEKK